MKKSDYMRSFNENGISVFLLRPLSDDPNSEVRGKIPMFKGWQQTGIHDEETIENYCDIAECTGAGYGVLCRNLLVIDVDARNGGVESFNKLYDKFPQIGGAGLIVETGSGGGSKHYYFKLDSEIRVSSHLKEYPGIDFKHSGLVVGPGSMHRSGRVYSVLSGNVEDVEAVPEGLLSLLKPQEYERVSHGGENFIVDDEVLKSALAYVYCYDDYHEWINIGMAIHKATNGDGVAIWDEWSSRGKDYNERDIHYKWGGFGKAKGREITAGTIFKIASDNGWVRNQDDFIDMSIVPEAWYSWSRSTQTATEEYEEIVVAEQEYEDNEDEDEEEMTPPDEEYAKLENSPTPLEKVNLTKIPAGLVADLSRWVDSQCAKPRKHLAAMAAIYSVSTIGGLRHRSVGGLRTNTTTNMLTFGIAHSASGKDPVINAVREILSMVGYGYASYPDFKSNREVYINLLRHRMANYIIDEFGDRLSKIANAKSNGASYLEGTLSTLMDIYSKSSKKAIIGGDMAEEFKESLIKKLSYHKKAIEENEDKYGFHAEQCEEIEGDLQHYNEIINPFISFFGVATHDQLSDIMTLSNVEKGFVGRAIIFIENNEFPDEREDHIPPSIPMGLQMRLRSLAHGTKEFKDGSSIRLRGDPMPIGYEKEAAELLKMFARWQNNYAKHQRQEFNSPFGPLYKRMAEMANKISLTLGMEEGTVTLEHAKWSIAVAWNDAQTKIAFVKEFDKSFQGSKNISSTIMEILSKNDGLALGQIVSRSRFLQKSDKTSIVEHISQLIKKGDIRKRETKNKRTGVESVKFYLIKGKVL